jgi:hypothetical protein
VYSGVLRLGCDGGVCFRNELMIASSRNYLWMYTEFF